MRKIICIVTAFVMILTLLTGCSVLQKLGLQKSDNDELTPASSIVMGEEEAQALSDKAPIYLYFANADNTKLTLEVRYVSQAETKKSTNSLANLIINELIKGPTTKGLNKTIPDGTKLLGVDVKSNVATVNFSQEFVNNHPGGRTAEQMTLYSVANTLTELKDVEKVKFLINGKTQKEYKGNFQFDALFPKNTSLISKPAPASSSVSSDASKETAKTDTTKKQDTKSNPSPTPSKSTDTKSGATTKPSSSTGTNKSTSTTKSTSAAASEEDEATYLDSLDLLE